VPDSMEASFRFRMNDETKSRLESMADRTGRSQGEVLRSLIEDQSLPDRRPDYPDEVQKLVRELARIGNNLNQVARVANRYQGNAEAVQICTALVTIEKQIERLTASLLPTAPGGDPDGEN
jgi:predicted transcriptional regulator